MSKSLSPSLQGSRHRRPLRELPAVVAREVLSLQCPCMTSQPSELATGTQKEVLSEGSACWAGSALRPAAPKMDGAHMPAAGTAPPHPSPTPPTTNCFPAWKIPSCSCRKAEAETSGRRIRNACSSKRLYPAPPDPRQHRRWAPKSGTHPRRMQGGTATPPCWDGSVKLQLLCTGVVVRPGDNVPPGG